MILSGMAVGAAMVTVSVVGMIRNNRLYSIRREVLKYKGECKCAIMEGVRVVASRAVSDRELHLDVLLPYGMSLEKFESHLPGLELATAANIQFRHLYGRRGQLQFGLYPFSDRMDYFEVIESSDLRVPLYTPFGLKYLNFEDETCCHLIVGGATRMGKTVFLRLLTTHLLRSMDGNIRILLMDNKVTDLYPFQDIPQITTAETVGESKMYLDDILQELEDRKRLLKERGDVVDARDFRRRYPGESMPPIFIIVDEYGRFSDDEAFQNKVIQIAETAGYLDVHLIIATQRPDATSVLQPRIKANIVTRMAFSTADELNSRLILGLPDAAHLGRIQGRAVLLDGFPVKVQVPYLSPELTEKLLQPYKKGSSIDVIPEGQTIDPVSTEIPSFVKGPDREADLPDSGKASRQRKPRSKKVES